MHFYPNYLPYIQNIHDSVCASLSPSPSDYRTAETRQEYLATKIPSHRKEKNEYDEEEGNGEIVISAGRRLILRAAPVRS